MCAEYCSSNEEKPNHMIVWLDLHIGCPEEYQHLKNAFCSTADPKHAAPLKLIDKDHDELSRTIGPSSINFEGVKFLLAAFTNAERCVKFLEQNRGKRVFFITSGQMGRVVVPLLMEKCKDIFTDPVTNEPYLSIYIFCADISRHMDWLLDYREYVAPFTFDADLLSRMIFDIAGYFVVQGKRLLAVHRPNYSTVYDHLSWAYTLYDRYTVLEGVSLKQEFDELNELLSLLESIKKAEADDDDE